jgi:hypothetical protein
MGVLFIISGGEYNFQSWFHASAERRRTKDFAEETRFHTSRFSNLIFHRRKILLGFFFIPRRTGPFFETGGAVSAIIAVKCLGTR